MMMFDVDWSAKIGDNELDNFDKLGFIVLDEVFDLQDFLALQHESGLTDYEQAYLTGGQKLSDIRGDGIRWIDECCRVGFDYLNSMDKLGEFFNRLYYFGIKRSEAHYACYPSGFGYKWHSDNPKGKDDRVISAVFYLNDNWQKTDGGQISIYDKNNKLHQLSPKANRLIIFDSNLLHQVEITHRTRYSIATWLRRDVA